MCTLDLSKALMHKFLYGFIKNKCGNNSGLLFTNTDGLLYETDTEKVYGDFSKDKEIFKIHNYSAKPNDFDDSNNSVVGKVEDETCGYATENFVLLNPKTHSCLVDDRR